MDGCGVYSEEESVECIVWKSVECIERKILCGVYSVEECGV